MAKQKVQAKRTSGQAIVSRNDDKLDASSFAIGSKKDARMLSTFRSFRFVSTFLSAYIQLFFSVTQH